MLGDHSLYRLVYFFRFSIETFVAYSPTKLAVKSLLLSIDFSLDTLLHPVYAQPHDHRLIRFKIEDFYVGDPAVAIGPHRVLGL